MARKQLRICAVHDISCIGRCSLTAAVPIISAAGIEANIIPTAVLSTQTGGFEGYTYRDLTEDIVPVAEHWKTLGVEFDAFYTGFLGSIEQISIVSSVIDRLKTRNTAVIVDPVMADNGKLYPVFDSHFPAEMKKLCRKADLIIPNMTEAMLMLGESYKEGPYTREYIASLMKRLTYIGPSNIVLTGVFFDDSTMGAVTYDRERNEICYCGEERIKGSFHGTGDIFASALTAGLMKGLRISDAAALAVSFVVESIKRTVKAGTDPRYGLNFEEGLSGFSERIAALQTRKR